jgi:pyruvate,orthophosphate dikinase
VTHAYALDALPAMASGDLRALVGGKAAGLAVMSTELGLPVPPGFVITTDVCRLFLADGWPAGLDDEIRARMAAVEATVGRRFGDPGDPLLVSVRSGAPVSMPGMMDTILNLGLNDGTTTGLARASGDTTFAERCRERLTSSFRAIVGIEAPDDPWQQLRLAVEAVFGSWQSDRAVAYRAKENIPDGLGTAVTVQAMVFGNRGTTSATGVLFTRDPATGEPTLYGDILFDAQGEDVVAGTHATEPIAVLDERLPAVAAELRDHAARLEHHLEDMCDIEFTIEDGRLWMLQCRVGKRSPQAALRIALDMAEDSTFPLTRAEAVERVAALLANPPTTTRERGGALKPLTTGMPASPGIASGPIATSPEAALLAADEGRAAILVRADTSPDDVPGMARAAGILTSRGGLASHAAVVARGWGIPAVVGAAEVAVHHDTVVVGDRTFQSGEIITIDGSTGDVFEGAIPVSRDVVPEASPLLDWATELGIPIPQGAPDIARIAPDVQAFADAGASDRAASPDACLRAVAVKGFASVQAIADAVLSTPDVVQPAVDRLLNDGLLAIVADAFRLTDAGTARAEALRAEDQAAWGLERANAALDAFLGLDHRMKDTVTAWQVRDAAAQKLNDHADPDYDRRVLASLADLHADAVAWLAPHEVGCARLGDYGVRLGRALERALAGDQRFVASPRVDSYHGIWFELHEDLIGLAGRTRADEVAAGRA